MKRPTIQDYAAERLHHVFRSAKPHPDKTIDAEILEQIENCAIMLADLTDHRPAVLFEAGYARGLGKNVIYTCHRRDHGECCLDIKHYWREPWDEDDLDSLADRLAVYMQEHDLRARPNCPGVCVEKESRVGKFDKSAIRETYRVGVFVDSENTRVACQRKWGRDINYGKLMQVALAGHSLHRGLVYAVRRDNKTDQWIRAVEVYGFEVKAKRLVRRSNGRENVRCHGELIIDLVTLIDQIDMVVIVSGRTDYVCAVKYCQELGKVARVIGVPDFTYKDLKAVADEFVPVTDDMLLSPSG